jgi:hypothetical protein
MVHFFKIKKSKQTEVMMGLFDIFSSPPCPGEKRPEVKKMIEELIQIGNRDDFLSERPGTPFNLQCRHLRAIEIGKRLDEIGGWVLMDYVRRRIAKKMNPTMGEHLGYAWTGIGDWTP